MAQMRDCADASVRLARVTRGAIEPKGGPLARGGYFLEIATRSVRASVEQWVQDCQTKPMRSSFGRDWDKAPIKASQGGTSLYKEENYSRKNLEKQFY